MSGGIAAAALLIFLTAVESRGQGSVCAVGGGGENYSSWSDAPYAWIVQKADSGRIIVLSANSETTWLPDYLRSLGADTAFNLRIASTTVADDSATFAAITQCTGVFIKGGDQWNYVNSWRNTLTEEAIRQVFLAGGVVAGTSAGAAVLGEIVFDARYSSPTSRQALRNPLSANLSLTTDFLNLVPDALFDSHFYERGRFGRLLAMMAKFQTETGRRILGIGLEAETALCIGPDREAEVMGAGSVVFYAATEQSIVTALVNQPLVYTNIRCDALVAGYRYNLNTRQVSYVPPTATTPGPGGAEPAVNRLTLFGDAFPSPAGITRFIETAGGGPDFVVIAPPAAAAAGQRYVDTLLARGAQSAVLIGLDAAGANNAAYAAAIGGAEGIILTSNLSEQFPAYVDSTTLVGQALRARLETGTALALAGQDAKLAGSAVVFRTELEEYASIRGKLTLGNGLHGFRNLLVMPLIFESSVYDENRTAGLPWGMAKTDGKTGIYLDEGGYTGVDAGGIVSSVGPTPAVILDARNATAVGYSTYRHSGSVGPRQSTAMIGATVHTIAGDARFDALSGTIITGVAEPEAGTPESSLILTNYPNPFNPSTTITFAVPVPVGTRHAVSLQIFDILGRGVATLVNDTREPGTYTVTFNASGLAGGVYFARLESGGRAVTRKLLLLR